MAVSDGRLFRPDGRLFPRSSRFSFIFFAHFCCSRFFMRLPFPVCRVRCTNRQVVDSAESRSTMETSTRDSPCETETSDFRDILIRVKKILFSFIGDVLSFYWLTFSIKRCVSYTYIFFSYASRFYNYRIVISFLILIVCD